MLPEWKYNQISRVKMLVNKILTKFRLKKNDIQLFDNRIEIIKQLSIAIDDVVKFYGIDKNKFFQNINNWKITEKRLFENAKNLREFYESWNDQAAVENACANIFNQLICFENYNVCAKYTIKSDVVIDYGCGTGALSLALALSGKIKNKLIQLDVPNDISKLRQFRIEKHNLTNVINENIFLFNEKDVADLIICIDVLEHIEDSSSVFINNIYPLLKVGGYMILRAPWRGQLTHIDQAADDFYLNGGRKFLSKNFKEVYRFGSLDIAAVYQKIK